MAIKKANGEGSINRYKNGWRGTITIGRDKEGKLIRKQFYGKTKLETVTKMNEYKQLHNRGLLPSDDKITLGQWFKIWLFEYRNNDLKTSSFERYESIYRLYIEGSQIFNIKLKYLRTSHLQNYYNILVSEFDKSVDTVKTINKHLKTCLNKAMKENYIPKNYCTLVTLPKKEKVKQDSITFFTLEEQIKFTESLEGHRLKAFFFLALGTGLRLCELMALTWEDIDFINNNVSVDKNLKTVKLFSDDGSYKYETIIQSPKTVNSIRTVPIPKKIVKVLKDHLTEQKKEKIKVRNAYIDNNLVFCTPLGTYLDESNI